MNRTRTPGFNEPVCLIYGNIIFIRISLENPVVSLVILMSMISSTYHLETSRKREIDTKGKLFALALAKDCYSMDLELLTNASVVKDAARFVSHYQQQQEHNSKNASVTDVSQLTLTRRINYYYYSNKSSILDR